MRNHYHLLLQTPRGNLAQIMRHINGAYTTYYNRKHSRSGHLLQGRYRAVVVDMDAFAQELSMYMHVNPVRRGLVERPEEYPWSSYCSYIGQERAPAWLTTDFILCTFAGHKVRAQRAYRRFVESTIGREYPDPLRQVRGATVLGDAQFVERLQRRHVRYRTSGSSVPALRAFAERPTIEQVAQAVGKVLEGDTSTIKNITMYLCHTYSGKRLKEIGLHFNIGESGVSQASRRMKIRLQNDPGIRKAIEEIQQRLWLSRE